MLAQEEDVEVHALRGRGWSIAAIARHTGRDRKTVRKLLAGPGPQREGAPSVLEPFREYLQARFGDDPHVLASVLLREIEPLGFDRAYQTLTRELRRLELRPRCECCRRGGVDVTTEIDHPPGEELQFDWLDLEQTPWGEPAYVLVGALSHSSQCRGVFSDGQSGPHVIEALDGVLRRLGGSARRWRTDRWRAWCTRAQIACCRRSLLARSTMASGSMSARRGAPSARASSRPRSVHDQLVVVLGRRSDRGAGAGEP